MSVPAKLTCSAQLGYRKPLAPTDAEYVNPSRDVKQHLNEVARFFKRRAPRNGKLALLLALHDTFRREFWLGGLAMLLANVLQIASPLILKQLLESLSDTPATREKHRLPVPVVLSIALFANQMFMSLCLVHYQYLGQVVGNEVKAVITAAIFNKNLTLASRERSTWTGGKVANLITVDSQRIQSALLYANMIWSEPIAVIMALVILSLNLGWTMLCGLVLLVAGAKALDFAMGRLVARRMEINERIDRRIEWLHEVLRNIRFVKLHAWEPYFLRHILDTRDGEIRQQTKLLNLRNTIMSLSMALPSFAAMISFVLFMTLNRRLTPAEAFSSLALFNCLRKPLNILPLVMSQLVDAWISLQRVQTFLGVQDQEQTISFDPNGPEAVKIVDGCFSWDAAAMNHLSQGIPDAEPGTPTDRDHLVDIDEQDCVQASFVLQDINLDIDVGELVAVVGSVGSGKSTFLSSLANQTIQLGGKITLNTIPSFCSQTPWIMSASVRDNILLGKPMRRQWYDQVLHACALTPDLNTWSDGDSTLIGEQGITLSGGQKQRIGLARAIYADSDLILLDDPLSAVDADVGYHIFTHAIRGLLHGKTRVLVTHQEKLLPHCTRLLWLEKGHVKAFDTFLNLSAQGALHVDGMQVDQSLALQPAHHETRSEDEVSEPDEINAGKALDQKDSALTPPER